MKLFLSNDLCIAGAPSSFVSELRFALTIENPAYLDAKKMGRYTGNTLQYLRYYETVDDGIIVPRGLFFLRLYPPIFSSRGTVSMRIQNCLGAVLM